MEQAGLLSRGLGEMGREGDGILPERKPSRFGCNLAACKSEAGGDGRTVSL